MAFKDLPKENDIQSGDLFIVHTIEPGDEVVLPSFFTCQPGKEAGTVELYSSGVGELRFEGMSKPQPFQPGAAILRLDFTGQ